MVEKKIGRRVIFKKFIYAVYPNKPNRIHHLNNSLLISMWILRELPQQKNPKVLC
jgi:hypothetical protein